VSEPLLWAAALAAMLDRFHRTVGDLERSVSDGHARFGEQSRSELERRVVLVSPALLIAYLSTVLLGLRGMEVERRAQELVGRLGALDGDLGELVEELGVVSWRLGTANGRLQAARRHAAGLRTHLDGLVATSRPASEPEPEADEP
jgi:DNA anti-recombination protein RmuC